MAAFKTKNPIMSDGVLFDDLAASPAAELKTYVPTG
jgi:hypothetical protein